MLQLNCLTTHHADIWNRLAPNLTPLGWSATYPGLAQQDPQVASDTWHRDCALRMDVARRQALLEVDVLVAMALGLTLDELIQIYRLVFPTLRNYEENTWYDQRGRIVWSRRSGKGLSISRAAWEQHRHLQRGCLGENITVTFLSNEPQKHTIEYEAPFVRPNRETDYRVAWKFFKRQSNAQATLHRMSTDHG